MVLQSDDWGRAGLRDRGALDQLRAEEPAFGERPYDFYTLETADDLAALREVLGRHRDSSGQPARLVMNFILANLDFARMRAEEFRQIHLLPLTAGIPEGWIRPGLFQAYRDGIAAGIFRPALHGMTHFSRAAVERNLADASGRTALLTFLWRAGVSYIHWRMPWIGYEYWDPELPEDERFLSFESQCRSIGEAVGEFAKLFSTLPRSACAPGYRANKDTDKAWAQYGVRVVQNGPGTLTPPHFGPNGLLHLYRTVEFEPATDAGFSIDDCRRRAKDCFALGIPAIVSLHSINFHSSVRDFRSRSLELLDQFLSALQMDHPDLLYLDDEDLYDLVGPDAHAKSRGDLNVKVTKKNFTKIRVAS